MENKEHLLKEFKVEFNIILLFLLYQFKLLNVKLPSLSVRLSVSWWEGWLVGLS